ncbi:hypothetical protein Afer_0972 [Acidimicrobium ferrooxidans DSM 10331]|uniref:Uncharacterized protein n=1 Tax=Acidimicrobium ferrooxidans (strain DSM 10331 / JCM 15462 / NBRC 103882 / ICP) TaxID=525909 RepID=C7LYV3_ACIFD|nr:hypothetical protein [Acidimicrobium ferrooxidans]ACU53911.1 hypothetical protein Afer_0972 [Acidimicrobium ferrooxidans DSM 10331]
MSDGGEFILTCFVCGEQGSYRSLHAHLVDAHPELVVIESGPRPSYALRCPVCGEAYRQAIKRGRADRDFVAAFERDVRVVGMDIMLQHVIGEHPDAVGVDLDALATDADEPEE